MAFAIDFIPLPLEQLHREASIMKVDGWRFIQTLAANGENGIDLYYSFMKDGRVVNYRVEGVQKGQLVPSITDLFLAAFVFENEARELFGVNMGEIAIDFGGGLYAPAEQEPMTFISPEQKAARDKARKAAAAKAAKEEGCASDAPAAKGGFVMTPERRARLDAKLANMSPEKVAKVEAALKAREAEAAAATAAPAAEPTAKAGSEKPAKPAAETPVAAVPDKPVDSVLESKIAIMDPVKAEKVRAAFAAAGVGEAAAAVADKLEEIAVPIDIDSQIEAKLAQMDEAKAEKVRAALAAKAARDASSKGGE